jgi:hypothetical protein
MKAKSSAALVHQRQHRHKTIAAAHPTAAVVPFSAHEYLKPLDNAAGYCKRCARRSVPCLKCSYCLLCHPYKEIEEFNQNGQTRLSSFLSLGAGEV